MIFFNGKLTYDIVHNFYKKYYVEGFSKLYICSTDYVDKNVVNFVRINYNDKIILLNEDEIKEKLKL